MRSSESGSDNVRLDLWSEQSCGDFVCAVVVVSGAIGENGTARPSFNYKGVIYVCNNEEKPLSKDEALEKAIEAGAEEVIDGYDDDDRPALKVTNAIVCRSDFIQCLFCMFVTY